MAGWQRGAVCCFWLDITANRFSAVEEDLEGRSRWGDWMRRAPAQVDVSGVCHTRQLLILGERHTGNIDSSPLKATVLRKEGNCHLIYMVLLFFQVRIAEGEACSSKMITKSWGLPTFQADLWVGTHPPPWTGKVVVCLLFLNFLIHRLAHNSGRSGFRISYQINHLNLYKYL